jgi:hypothetical protein
MLASTIQLSTNHQRPPPDHPKRAGRRQHPAPTKKTPPPPPATTQAQPRTTRACTTRGNAVTAWTCSLRTPTGCPRTNACRTHPPQVVTTPPQRGRWFRVSP